ncbi:MAG TPA: hypothetical protein DCM10_15210, partial [Xanthomarina gelatinilytica]|nr:hypothetical protein [Xanthomarina gelatinilytica]
WKDHKIFRHISIPAILEEHTDNEKPNWSEYWSLDGKWEMDETVDTEVFIPGLRDIRDEIC